MSASIQLTFDLTKGNWSRFGISWFTRQIFFKGQGPTPEKFNSALDLWYAEAAAVLKTSPVLSGLDITDEIQLEEAHNRIRKIGKKDSSPEYWAMLMHDCIPEVREAINCNNAEATALTMAAVASARSMLVFLQLFEETVWRGHTVARLERTLEIWADNRDNSDEDFWHEQLAENAYVLSQVFSFPVIILREQAYLGGKSVDNTGGNLVDFLLKNNLSQNTALIEIKTPKTKLLGMRYRQAYSISGDLSGAIVQVSSYKDSLLKNYIALIAQQSDLEFCAFNPRCLVIAGTLDNEITDRTKGEAFELFRSGLRDVQVITYDELFGKIEILLNLFKSDVV
jgi:hypothetical protein